MKENSLGKGGYGEVTRRGNKAIKKFQRCCDLMLEYAAGSFLKDCPHVVKVTDLNLNDMTLSMPLYMGSLKAWLVACNSEQRTRHAHSVYKSILIAVCWLHDLGLIHGDLKPSNILCDWQPDTMQITKLVLGDLGFVAPHAYSKTHLTAETHREYHNKSDQQHDIYSLTIIALQLFAGYSVKKQLKTPELEATIRQHIRDPTLAHLLIAMTSSNRNARPSVRSCLITLGYCDNHTSPQVVRHPGIEIHEGYLTASQEKAIDKIFAGYHNKIKRDKLASQACRSWINQHKIDTSMQKKHAIAMLILANSIFGHQKYHYVQLLKHFRVSEKDMNKIIEQYLLDDNLLACLFYTSKANH